MRVIPLLRIPPGALLAVNPKLFLQAKSVTQITKDDWHAFYDRIESLGKSGKQQHWQILLNRIERGMCL